MAQVATLRPGDRLPDPYVGIGFGAMYSLEEVRRLFANIDIPDPAEWEREDTYVLDTERAICRTAKNGFQVVWL